MRCPTKVELVPRVAELPTCQKTLQGCAPLIRVIVLETAVTSVDEVRKIKTPFGSPSASRVRAPVISIVPFVYAPGVSVRPAPNSTPVITPIRVSPRAAVAEVMAVNAAPPRT